MGVGHAREGKGHGWGMSMRRGGGTCPEVQLHGRLGIPKHTLELMAGGMRDAAGLFRREARVWSRPSPPHLCSTSVSFGAALPSAVVEGSATEEEAHRQLPDISLGCCALTKGNARRMLTL